MAKSKYAMKRDENERGIIDALEKVGAKVDQVTEGKGIPDLLVGFRKKIFLLEVKDGNKPPSKRKLTEDQQKFFMKWKGFPVFKVNDEKQALIAIGAIEE